jgi:hypothetical protein
MPNAFAFLVLFAWPLAAWALFRALGPARGTVATILLGYLLLPPAPAGIDPPLLPPLTKDTIPSLCALLFAGLALRGSGLSLIPAHPVARALLALGLVSPAFTVVTNGDPVVWGQVVLPGLRLREGLSASLALFIGLIPYLLGRALLATGKGQRDLMLALLLGALGYSLPMLLEVRLSPQLNTWIYGYFQHLFEQMMRGDGFRPIVFLYHGLWAAFLALTGVLAACALARAEGEPRRRVAFLAAAAWMLMVLVLCKSLASLLYALAFAPILLLAGTRAQLRLAALLACLALAYPAARGAHLVPDDALVSLIARAAPERAHSLHFRFDNEDVLLARAEERPLFGWGMWGRHHVYDPDTGRPLTITDGRWIVVVGVLGWTGFLAEFGLLALPLLLAWWRMGATPPPPLVAATALMLAVNVLDLIPNATLTPLTLLMAGALLGWAERRHPAAATAAPDSLPASGPAFRTVL